MNSVFSANFMSPNLVFQQGISHHKNTLPPSMSLSTFEPSMVDSQSIINGQYKFFHTLKWNQMDLYNQYLIPTIYSHTAQQVGLNSFPPNSPVKLPSTVPTLPLHSEGHPLVRPFSHLLWACCRPEWWRTWSGVGGKSKKKKVGEATGPQVGEKVKAQRMLDVFVVEIL